LALVLTVQGAGQVQQARVTAGEGGGVIATSSRAHGGNKSFITKHM